MIKFTKKYLLLIFLLFFVVPITSIFLFFNMIDDELGVNYISLITIFSFITLSIILIKKVLEYITSLETNYRYSQNLNDIIISESRNSLFYEGNTKDAAKTLTKEVTISISTDRCSVWLYNKDRTSIICEQLYVKSEDKWYENIELFKKDYPQYFLSIQINPIIIADDAKTHVATSCFTETYLNPLDIKSMLDVPIFHKGEIIGVICIESLIQRKWTELELNFAQMLSSLYSFTYSAKENNIAEKNIQSIENFVDYSVLVSKADKKGRITYVNKKFEEVSGWPLKEVLGKDHNVVNSGFHTKNFWKNMYDTTVKERKVWNNVVTNKSKTGELYWVDSYIIAEFDSVTDEHIGFMSIRYDVTELIKTLKEIEKKNTYLEHASKILRHDMHSGINTYIPRGVSSLERRLNSETINQLKIEAPLKMIKEGLRHTQKVYKGVYEFTNLVKKDVVLNKTICNLKDILKDYLSSTSYSSQVIIDDLPTIEVNESLFCTAIDNLIRNGLKYNDSETKTVQIYVEGKNLIIQDNGRGMSQEDFEYLSQPYTRKKDQKESGTGLGLNICTAILNEHKFDVSCEKNKIGTKMKIKIL
jgi:PAS domain S-box-containing protein